METIEAKFHVEVIIFDENGFEVDLREFGDEVLQVAELIDASDIITFEEILGHLWMKIHFKRTFPGM